MITLERLAPWALKNAWSSASDRAALALCAEELAKIGVAFVDAANLDKADAVKLHGFELVEAIRAGEMRLTDLHAVAQLERWAERIDPRAWQFMTQGKAVYGVPMGIHQSNGLWSNVELASDIELETASETLDLVAWLRRASSRIAKPFAIGREAWQIGILFETLCLAEAGAARYRRAFVDLDSEALGGVEVMRALAKMLEVRDLVDDGRLDVPWRSLLRDVGEGKAAAILMGDWVSASGLPLHRLQVQELRDACIYVVDLFAPLGESVVSPRVAAALTAANFQTRFARVKGCSPAVVDAPYASNEGAGRDAPSLTFDQCCPVSAKNIILEIVAGHFLARHDPAQTAERLYQVGTLAKVGG
jgi:glucose/mannose transport system substrate-binding protein